MMTALRTSSWGSQPTLSLDMLRTFSTSVYYSRRNKYTILIPRSSNSGFFIRLFRCQDAEAFELSSSGFTNGVFVKFLKKRLLDDEKITVVLDRVAEGERRKKQHKTLQKTLFNINYIRNVIYAKRVLIAVDRNSILKWAYDLRDCLCNEVQSNFGYSSAGLFFFYEVSQFRQAFVCTLLTQGLYFLACRYGSLWRYKGKAGSGDTQQSVREAGSDRSYLARRRCWPRSRSQPPVGKGSRWVEKVFVSAYTWMPSYLCNYVKNIVLSQRVLELQANTKH